MQNYGQNIIVFSSMPSEEVANETAKKLVTLRYAACCLVMPGIKSVYRWKNELCVDKECLLVIKTTEIRYQEVENYIREQHPYELPECIAVPIHHGTEEYLQWIEDQVT